MVKCVLCCHDVCDKGHAPAARVLGADGANDLVTADRPYSLHLFVLLQDAYALIMFYVSNLLHICQVLWVSRRQPIPHAGRASTGRKYICFVPCVS
jgi:hypothetical protein